MKYFVSSLTAIFLLGVFSVGSVLAGVEPGNGVLMVKGGYVTGTTELTGESADGGIISLSYEKLGWGKPVSAGFVIGYSEITEEESKADSVVNRSINTVPLYFGSKFWFGKGTVQGFGGLGVGTYFTTIKTTITSIDETYSSVSTVGWGFGVPLGLTVSIGETLLISGNYTLNWMFSNEAFDNDLLHTFNLGVGFILGK